MDIQAHPRSVWSPLPRLDAAPNQASHQEAHERSEDVALERAFRDAYLAHRAGLLRWLVVRTRDEPAAEDICQEAFVRLYRELLEGRAPHDPAAWLRRVGLNLVISRARRAEVAARHASRLREPEGGDPTARLVLDRERLSDVRAALGRIPHQHRPILLLAARGLDNAELAARLGVGTGAARTRLHRARRELLRELEVASDAG